MVKKRNIRKKARSGVNTIKKHVSAAKKKKKQIDKLSREIKSHIKTAKKTDLGMRATKYLGL